MFLINCVKFCEIIEGEIDFNQVFILSCADKYYQSVNDQILDKNIEDENKYLVKRMIAKIACKKIFKLCRTSSLYCDDCFNVSYLG